MNIDVNNFQFRKSRRIQEEVTPSRLESIRQAVCRALPMRQPGIRMTPSGWMLDRSVVQGGSSRAPLGQLVLTDRQPSYAQPNPDPNNPAVWLTWGMVLSAHGQAGVEPIGIFNPILPPADQATWIWLKMDFQNEAELIGATVHSGETLPVQPQPDEDTGNPPDHIIYSLGRVVRNANGMSLFSSGQGSVGYFVNVANNTVVAPTANNPGGFIAIRRVYTYRQSVS